MKTLPTGMQAHLDSGATTICHLWRITRADGVVLCFTDHDENIVISSGVIIGTYLAASSFTMGSIETRTGMAVSNLEIVGGIDDTHIVEDDILSNKYDNAFVELVAINWMDYTQYVTLLSGNIGDIKKDGIGYTAEIISLLQRLNSNIGRTYTRNCDTNFASSRCGLLAATYQVSGTVLAVPNDHQFTASDAAVIAKDNDWFTRGVVTFTSGYYINCAFNVKLHLLYAGTAYFTLWNKLEVLPTVGDTFTAIAGCTQTLLTCKNKFNNVINFQGFPSIPGNALLTAVPVAGGANQSGLSLIGTYE